MAEKTKKTKEAKPEASTEVQDQMAKARAARTSSAGKDLFTHLGDPEGKVAPQCQGIINIVKEKGPITREDLVKAMEGVITSKQPLARILSYYVPVLKSSKAVEITQAVPSVA